MDYFLTVDAETACIPEGVPVLSGLRDELEQKVGLKVPVVWFVRFQRRTKEDTAVDGPAGMSDPPQELFDGFGLAKDRLLALQDRGDEIGWHYHAYNFAYRPELPRADRLDYLHADLRICARELRRLHPEFAVRSFRFGWFFVPDYGLYKTLGEVGIVADASNRADDGATLRISVNGAEQPRLPPLAGLPRRIDGVGVFPHDRTIITHDYNAVAHDLGWRASDAREAALARDALQGEMARLAADALANGGRFTTYRAAARRI